MKGKLLKTFASSAVALSMLVGCSSGSGTASTVQLYIILDN